MNVNTVATNMTAQGDHENEHNHNHRVQHRSKSEEGTKRQCQRSVDNENKSGGQQGPGI
jgi:hypothetical protein